MYMLDSASTKGCESICIQWLVSERSVYLHLLACIKEMSMSLHFWFFFLLESWAFIRICWFVCVMAINCYQERYFVFSGSLRGIPVLKLCASFSPTSIHLPVQVPGLASHSFIFVLHNTGVWELPVVKVELILWTSSFCQRKPEADVPS